MKFKVGDRVKILHNIFKQKGQVSKVINIDPGSHFPIHVAARKDDPEYSVYVYQESQLKLYNGIKKINKILDIDEE